MSAAASIRVGVLGVGRIGRMHAELVARHVPGLTLAAVYDAQPEVAFLTAAQLGVRACATASELIEAADVDAVAICSSTDTHVGLLVEAAATGKPVFLEKPISLDLAEVDRGLAAVERAGSFLQLGLNRRFDPAHRSVREAVVRGVVGELALVRITSRDPAPPPLDYVKVSGGLFLDMTVHDFDMARFVTGSEIEEVFARGAVRVDPAIGEAGDVDTAVVTVVHTDDTLTAIDNSRRSSYGYDQRVEAFGSKGVASSDNVPVHTGSLRTADGTRCGVLQHFFIERYHASYVAGWKAFEHAVRHDEAPPVTGADGRAALVVGLAAWRSVREGRPVRTSEI